MSDEKIHLKAVCSEINELNSELDAMESEMTKGNGVVQEYVDLRKKLYAKAYEMIALANQIENGNQIAMRQLTPPSPGS